jgi:selenocysteine lyase/cysteine desulfurase
MLSSHRNLFDVPRGVAYLNNVGFKPLPRSVRAAGEAGVASESTPWLMDPRAIEACAEAVRAAAASFIAATADDIAIMPSAAYSVATAAANLTGERGTRILLIEGEFPSHALEWARLAEERGAMLDVVPRPHDGNWIAALLERIIQSGLPPVGIAALAPLGWTDGTLTDLELLIFRLCAARVPPSWWMRPRPPASCQSMSAGSVPTIWCSRPINGC